MSKSYANRIELRDGAVMLYQKPGAKRGFWYYRIHVRGMHDIAGAKVKYDERSTGETDLDEAKRVSLERHDDLKVRVRAKQPVKSFAFADLYELWWAQKKQRLNLNHIAKGREGKSQRIDWFAKQSQRYWLPYFGKHKVEDLTHALIEGYWAWRMAYWSNASATEREEYPNYALTPSKKTLDMEQGSLSEIFAWGNSMQLFSFQPVIRNPYSRLGIPASRRPSFEDADWTTISEYLERWSVGCGNNDDAEGARLNSSHLYQRKMLKLYVEFIVATGMRPGEMLKVRHRDVSVEETRNSKIRHLVINVAHDTKTGSRKVIGERQLNRVYADITRLSKHTEPEDWLFCDPKGKPSKGFGKTLHTVLKDLNLLTDRFGKRRTSYSFRHFYAEQQLKKIGQNPRAFDLIATNMGTSRQMLETHYVRKGIIDDQEAMLGLAPDAIQAVKAKQGLKDAQKMVFANLAEEQKARIQAWNEAGLTEAEKKVEGLKVLLNNILKRDEEL